jgi:acetyl esterase/lipase
VAVAYDPGADLSDPGAFYDQPWPMDGRVTAGGRLDVAGLPRPADHAPAEQLLALLAEQTAFSQVPLIVFRFQDAPRARGIDDGVLGGVGFFVNVDPDHPERGRVVPAYGGTPPPDPYTPQHALVLQPVHGFVLDPDTTWAAVVLRSWGDEGGEDLGVPAALRVALREDARFAELGAVLGESGVGLDDVAAATVFTTGDPVAETFALTEAARDAWTPEITDLAIDPDDGADHARFCELHGTVRLPQFQQGTPPFDTEGTFAWDGETLPPMQREEDVPVAISLPLGEMPAGGWPVVVYNHGSGGAFDQVIDRGPTLEPGGERQVGLGPAHVLAGRGIAAVGMGQLLGESREGGESGRGYLNLLNLSAYRDTWRQGMIDTRLLIDALETLAVSPEAVAGCPGLALPDGADAHVLDVQRLMMMGQSAGGHVTMEVGALDPRVQAVTPTGAGGYWTLVMTTDPREGVPASVTGFALGTHVVPDALHPGLALLQAAWEPAEPLVYAPRLSRQPLPGHAPRDIYLPIGQDDGYFPEPIFDAMALACDVELTGPSLWPAFAERLDLGGLTARPEPPVADNRETAGAAWTGVTNHWAPDGIVDSHSVFAQEEGIKHQYGCFFRTRYDAGVATLVAPGGESDPCE